MTVKPNSRGLVGEGVPFERIRRITGYLAGTVERFNNAKRAEEHDRVKHGDSTGLFLVVVWSLFVLKITKITTIYKR